MWKGYVHRTLLLLTGLGVSAVGVVLMLRANIGLEPWSALHRGLELTTGISFGGASIVVGAAVIVLAILLGERFGLGTIANIVLCGLFIDALIALNFIPEMHSLPASLLMLLAGLELLAIGTWLYMRSGLGVGPRDALMVALARRVDKSVGLCRSALELLCILAGYLMGAQIGVGTIVAAIGIGALFNLNFRLLRFDAAALPQETILETLRNLTGRV